MALTRAYSEDNILNTKENAPKANTLTGYISDSYATEEEDVLLLAETGSSEEAVESRTNDAIEVLKNQAINLITEINKFVPDDMKADQVEMHRLSQALIQELGQVKVKNLNIEQHQLILTSLDSAYKLCQNPEDAVASKKMGDVYDKIKYDRDLGGKSLPMIIAGMVLLAVGVAALAFFAPMALAATGVIGAATLGKAGMIGAGITAAVEFMGASAAICAITSTAVSAVTAAVGGALSFLGFKESGFASSLHGMFSVSNKHQKQVLEQTKDYDWKSPAYITDDEGSEESLDLDTSTPLLK